MSEKIGGESTNPVAKVADVDVIVEVKEHSNIFSKDVAEGISKGWEDERKFLTVREIVAQMEGVGIKTNGFEITRRVLNFDGVPLSIEMRAPGNISSYLFERKGDHGDNNVTQVSRISRIDFMATDPDVFDYSESMATYVDGIWVKTESFSK